MKCFLLALTIVGACNSGPATLTWTQDSELPSYFNVRIDVPKQASRLVRLSAPSVCRRLATEIYNCEARLENVSTKATISMQSCWLTGPVCSTWTEAKFEK